MIKKILVVVIAVLALAAIYFNYGAMPDAIEASNSQQRLQPGPYRVVTEKLTLIDDSRVTQANKEVPEKPSRTLETTIWYPENIAELGEQPLLVYSHGFSSSRAGGAHIARHLASKGYIVAAANFPLTNTFTEGGPNILDVVNQPGDVSFLIDQMMQWHSDPNHRFGGRIDEDRIAVAGLSLGGLTTTLVAYHRELRDPRIDLAISIAGPSAPFGPNFYQTRAAMPMMMLASPIDPLVTYKENAEAMKNAHPSVRLVTVDAGSHTGFSAQSRAMRFMNNPDSLACKLVLKNIGDDLEGDGDWTDLFGGEENGVIANAGGDRLCETQPLPEAMNPVRQLWITVLAVDAFIEQYFASEAAERDAARNYFEQHMSAELPDVSLR